ncbi:MAG: hypothetical protein ACOX8D_11090 [Methanoculleus sp.]
MNFLDGAGKRVGTVSLQSPSIAAEVLDNTPLAAAMGGEAVRNNAQLRCHDPSGDDYYVTRKAVRISSGEDDAIRTAVERLRRTPCPPWREAGNFRSPPNSLSAGAIDAPVNNPLQTEICNQFHTSPSCSSADSTLRSRSLFSHALPHRGTPSGCRPCPLPLQARAEEYPTPIRRPDGEAAGEYRSISNLFPSMVRMS